MIDATLTMVGQHGPVRGGPSGPVRGGGAIPVLDVRHTLVSPFDPVTGQRTGRRRHSPVVILKEVDRATPTLLAAWGRNEVLTTWRLDVSGADGLGRRRTACTIELRHAFVVGVSLLTADVPMPREEISFGYEAITWTWVDGRITTTDEWGGGP